MLAEHGSSIRLKRLAPDSRRARAKGSSPVLTHLCDKSAPHGQLTTAATALSLFCRTISRQIEAAAVVQTHSATFEGEPKTADDSIAATAEKRTASPPKEDEDQGSKVGSLNLRFAPLQVNLTLASVSSIDSQPHATTAATHQLRSYSSLDGDAKPLVHASAGLLEAILPAYESLVCELQTLKGKGAKDEEAVRYLRNLLPEFGALNDLMAKRKRRA